MYLDCISTKQPQIVAYYIATFISSHFYRSKTHHRIRVSGLKSRNWQGWDPFQRSWENPFLWPFGLLKNLVFVDVELMFLDLKVSAEGPCQHLEAASIPVPVCLALTNWD